MMGSGSGEGRWVPDPTFPLLGAFLAGIRWAADHPSSAHNTAEVIKAAIAAAQQEGRIGDAQWMTEFCMGSAIVRDGLDEWQECHEEGGGDGA